MPRQPRPKCRICARKVALDTTGRCYDCKANPPKFRIGQRVDLFSPPDWNGNRRKLGTYAVSKAHYSLDYGWEYSFTERRTWRIGEAKLEEVK